jgi:hypothetical protein
MKQRHVITGCSNSQFHASGTATEETFCYLSLKRLAGASPLHAMHQQRFATKWEQSKCWDCAYRDKGYSSDSQTELVFRDMTNCNGDVCQRIKHFISHNGWTFEHNNSVPLVRKRTIPTERPPLVGEVQSFADIECLVVSAADPHGRILGFLDRSRYISFQVAPQLYSRGWVDPVPDPLLRKSGSAGNGTRDLWICSQELTTRPQKRSFLNISLFLK